MKYKEPDYYCLEIWKRALASLILLIPVIICGLIQKACGGN